MARIKLIVCAHLILILLGTNIDSQRIVCADEIYLTNGDRISGTVLTEDDNEVAVKTIFSDHVTIKKSFIQSITKSERDAIKPVISQKKSLKYTGELEGGYDWARGNSDTDELHARAQFVIKKSQQEWKIKASSYYKKSEDEIIAEKYAAGIRLTNKFGQDNRWFYYGEFNADHDLLGNIKYRLLPAMGFGYWIFNKDHFKLMLETGSGASYTVFDDDKDEEIAFTLIPKLYAEWNIWRDSSIITEIIAYPSVADIEDYRIYSEITLDNPINEKVSLKISLIDEYNSNPGTSIDKLDTRILTSLAYKI